MERGEGFLETAHVNMKQKINCRSALNGPRMKMWDEGAVKDLTWNRLKKLNGSFMEGRIEVTVERMDQVSVITDAYWQAPLKLSRPFSRGRAVHVIGMDSSPGMLDGDEQTYFFHVGEGAHLRFTTQSAQKIYPSMGRGVVQRVKIQVGKEGVMEYLPEGNIPFHDSVFRGDTRIELEEGAKLVYLDLWTAGRVGSGEAFQFRSWEQNLEIYREGKLLLWERSDWKPKEGDFSPLFHFGPSTQLGTLYLLKEGLGQKEAEEIGKFLHSPPDRMGGATLLPYGAGIGLKLMGGSRSKIRQLLLEVKEDF
ncbi:MAG: urease accessory protein UreD [Thermicanus sp.]|nr:urease accessory protein UreD [Thermicanus sp.]